LKNLLGNAIRYSDGGPVRIRISKAHDELVIVVEDEGPGFSDDQQTNFGEPFYRGDPSRTRDTGGYGLGLYLSKLVAQAHGGTLTIDPDYTDGARLVARLPA
jgi:signal transduction histidine kinase